MGNIPDRFTLVPLIWIFTYKFDSNGYLLKFKARICARGDLLESEDDPYAATLASQSFRAMMAIAVLPRRSRTRTTSDRSLPTSTR